MSRIASIISIHPNGKLKTLSFHWRSRTHSPRPCTANPFRCAYRSDEGLRPRHIHLGPTTLRFPVENRLSNADSERSGVGG